MAYRSGGPELRDTEAGAISSLLASWSSRFAVPLPSTSSSLGARQGGHTVDFPLSGTNPAGLVLTPVQNLPGFVSVSEMGLH